MKFQIFRRRSSFGGEVPACWRALGDVRRFDDEAANSKKKPQREWAAGASRGTSQAKGMHATTRPLGSPELAVDEVKNTVHFLRQLDLPQGGLY